MRQIKTDINTHAHKTLSALKSQSAMEYLMTYGWAILIIAVVLAVLFQLGVFSGSALTPKAPPGACQVERFAGQVSLVGECQGQLPQYTMYLSGTGWVTAGSLNMPNAYNTPYSITMWINIGTYPSGSGYELFYLGDLDDFQVIGGGPAGQLLAHRCSGADQYSGAAVTVPLDTWTFVGESVSNANYIFQANAKQATLTNAYPYPPSLTQPTVTIGGSGHCFPINFIGGMADVQVYNTSLSGSEMNSIYLEGIGGAPIKIQNLIGWYPLNGNLNDYSGYNNNGQAVGGVAFNGSWNSQYTPP